MGVCLSVTQEQTSEHHLRKPMGSVSDMELPLPTQELKNWLSRDILLIEMSLTPTLLTLTQIFQVQPRTIGRLFLEMSTLSICVELANNIEVS